MLKRSMLITALLVMPLVLSSCLITSRLINVDITCDEFNQSPHSIRNEFQVETGDKITVKLCSNPSTGFQWSYETSDDSVLMEEDHDFEEPEDSNVLGAPGKEVWTFEAIAEGTTEINMKYSRPWEESAEGQWTYKITVTVE